MDIGFTKESNAGVINNNPTIKKYKEELIWLAKQIKSGGSRMIRNYQKRYNSKEESENKIKFKISRKQISLQRKMGVIKDTLLNESDKLKAYRNRDFNNNFIVFGINGCFVGCLSIVAITIMIWACCVGKPLWKYYYSDKNVPVASRLISQK